MVNPWRDVAKAKGRGMSKLQRIFTGESDVETPEGMEVIGREINFTSPLL